MDEDNGQGGDEVTEPASVQWLRTQLPHGWMIVSPEVVSAIRNLLVDVHMTFVANDEGTIRDVAVIESALEVK